MRHNKRNKYFKIACSWILIFSMCFLSLNTVNASAEDTTAFESEPSTDQFTSENEETKQETEKQIPDSIKVDQLNAEIQNRVANGEVPSTDRVKYVDEKGKIIEGAPTTIELGKISDHTEITIADKKYEFKNAKVSDEDCVFIGQYENYVYYSTDGNIAKKLKDKQLLVMTYSESKNSVNEEIEQVATKDTNKSEESTEQIIDNEGGTEQLEELNVPESISVQSLDEALQISVANGDEQTIDRVEYVDANGNPIAGAPSAIGVGAIADHKELSIEGRHFEFKSAKVDGKNCVYIGKYNDTIYYSTDGVIAIKMEDGQKVTMTYQEYYFVTIKEVLPTNCDPGTICTKKGSEDVPVETNKQIRVNAGEDWVVSVTPGKDNHKPANYADKKERFKIESVKTNNGAGITQTSGDEYGATYKIGITQDDEVVITYTDKGVYHVTINTTYHDTTDNKEKEYINIEHCKGWTYLEDKKKIEWTFSEGNYGMGKDEIEIPSFHTKRGYRLVNMVLNGVSLFTGSESDIQEVPLTTGSALTTNTGSLLVSTEMVEQYTTNKEVEKDCSYEYKIRIKPKVTTVAKEWEDYNFKLAPYALDKQTLTVRLITDGLRTDEGIDAVMWDPDAKKLVSVKDCDAFDMSPVGSGSITFKTRRVRIFFAKPKPGYYSISAQFKHPHGGDESTGSKSEAAYGNIKDMNENSMGSDQRFNMYNDTWKEAKAAAQEAGYVAFVSYAGVKVAGDDSGHLYGALFADYKVTDLYVHYNSGAGKGVLPENADVKNIPYNQETNNQKKPMQSYGKNPSTNKGARGMGTTFVMGESCPEPTCEGYEFVGWKLKDRSGKLSDTLYKHGDLFTIAEDNYAYANNTNLPLCSRNDKSGYQIVAQWKKIDTKKVEVKHLLKKPDGTKILGNTTSGTISFATENESVKAFAKPETNGTFQGYVFDTKDSRNELEKEVKNDSSSDTITLNLYYKPTVLTVRKNVTGYNMEPNRLYDFTIKVVPPSGTDASTATVKDRQIFIKKGNDKVENLSFTNNQATFNLAKDESVDISCLPTGWTYTVTEKDPGRNYKTSYKLNDSAATDGTAAEFITSTTGNDEITFTNASTVAPPETGRTFHDSEWILLLIVILVISAGGMTFLRKMKKRY